MRIGTTPAYTFKLPFNVLDISKAKVTFRQGNELILEKYLKDCALEDHTLCVCLTQEETFKFHPHVKAEIQLRVQIPENVVIASPKYLIPVEECLDKEVL